MKTKPFQNKMSIPADTFYEYNRLTKYNISNNIIRAHGIFLKSLMVTSRWSVQPYLNVQNIFGLVGTLMGNGRHRVQQQSIGLVNP